MNTAIINYNAGNIHSVRLALQRLGREALVSDKPEDILNADKVIFPGVGEAKSAMNFLRAKNLDGIIMNLRQPVLGICLGLQLMCRHTEENNTHGLDIFGVEVKRFRDIAKVPHIGWNLIYDMKGTLFHGISESAYVYFVHSYYAEIGPDNAACCEYGSKFSAALQKDNYFAVQFHPEKSGTVGEQILKNFIEL